jgi:tetratricopeptide (TPR) repeat protein
MLQLGALPEAIERAELARSHALALCDRGHLADGVPALAATALLLCRCLAERGDHETASDRAREAIEALRQLPDLREADWFPFGVPLLAAWASAEVACGRGADAVSPTETQFAALHQAGWRGAEVQLPAVSLALGQCLRAAGQVPRALSVWTAALQSVAVLTLPLRAAELALCVSEAQRALGSHDLAVDAARRALAAARDARSLTLEVEALRALALALRDAGEPDDAEAQLGEALNALGRIDRQRLSAEVSLLLAAVLQARGALDEADAALAKSCRAFAAVPDLAGLSDALRRRGEIQMAHGMYSRALAFAEEAVRQAQMGGAPAWHVQALLLAARAAAAAGETQAAHQRMEEAFTAVAPDAMACERADCLVVLADLLEAGVLTSDRDPASLLVEARDLYAEAEAALQAEQLTKRLRAMAQSSTWNRAVLSA